LAIGRDPDNKDIHTLTLFGRVNGQRFQASGRGSDWADVFGQIEAHSAIQRAYSRQGRGDGD
jgi:hypothetical protein